MSDSKFKSREDARAVCDAIEKHLPDIAARARIAAGVGDNPIAQMMIDALMKAQQRGGY